MISRRWRDLVENPKRYGSSPFAQLMSAYDFNGGRIADML